MEQYENLSFEGGGVKGIAYAGAIKELESMGLMKGIKRVAGTSAGSILSCLLALGYNADGLQTILDSTDFASFEDHKNPARILTKYGLYRGEAFLDWIKDQIVKSPLKLKANATFEDLRNAGGNIDLFVYATNLNQRAVSEFSFKKTPNVIIAEAVRASMSIPLFFQAWKFSQGVNTDELYVDGGVVYIFPLTTFDRPPFMDKEGENMKTLGLHLDNLTGVKEQHNLGYDHILQYVKATFDSILDAQLVNFNQSTSETERTVKIDDFGISGTNFNLPDSDKTKLYNSGKACVKNYFANKMELA